jgi:hypothetical protein
MQQWFQKQFIKEILNVLQKNTADSLHLKTQRLYWNVYHLLLQVCIYKYF